MRRSVITLRCLLFSPFSLIFHAVNHITNVPMWPDFKVRPFLTLTRVPACKMTYNNGLIWIKWNFYPAKCQYRNISFQQNKPDLLTFDILDSKINQTDCLKLIWSGIPKWSACVIIVTLYSSLDDSFNKHCFISVNDLLCMSDPQSKTPVLSGTLDLPNHNL